MSRRVKVVAIEGETLTVELLTGEHKGKLRQLPANRVRPMPKVGDTLWHVEHNYWDIE